MEENEQQKQPKRIKAEVSTVPTLKAKELTFLQKAGTEGWPLADTVGKVVLIDYHPDKSVLALGFEDLNERKEIILSATLEKWESIFKDALAYIQQKKQEESKP